MMILHVDVFAVLRFSFVERNVNGAQVIYVQRSGWKEVGKEIKRAMVNELLKETS